MPAKVTARTFDYSGLDARTSRFVQQQTQEIRGLIQRTARDILEIGHKLLEIKERLEHGQFQDWLNFEFEWKLTTAWRFMQVAKAFKSSNLEDLRLAPSALYLLAAPSTPKAAREEALARASAGEPITYTQAQKLKQKHAQKASASEPQGLSQELNLAPTPDHLTPNERTTASRATDRAKFEPSSPQPEVVAPQRQLWAKEEKEGGRERWWKLDNKHLVYCGNPTSSEFQKKLPREIALWLAFPSQRNDWQNTSWGEVKSIFSFFTFYQDLDLRAIREAVERILAVCTEGNEPVVFAHLPDPPLLILAAQMECLCFVAEPDETRCEALLSVWQQVGGSWSQSVGNA